MARRQKKERTFSYSSDSNLDVNCRLMSRRSGMLLGNHRGIQEGGGGRGIKKIQLDRCTAERRNRAVVLSALSISHTTGRGAYGGVRTRCHTPQDSSSI